jgi:hypothetical protein
MAQYYVNNHAQRTGEHEVHRQDCRWLSAVISKTALGEHTTCQSAVREAKRFHANSDGCATCSPVCHTR